MLCVLLFALGPRWDIVGRNLQHIVWILGWVTFALFAAAMRPARHRGRDTGKPRPIRDRLRQLGIPRWITMPAAVCVALGVAAAVLFLKPGLAVAGGTLAPAGGGGRGVARGGGRER